MQSSMDVVKNFWSADLALRKIATFSQVRKILISKDSGNLQHCFVNVDGTMHISEVTVIVNELHKFHLMATDGCFPVVAHSQNNLVLRKRIFAV
jgi:hypothetical protein